jgi:hypothetical protein
MPYQGAKRPGYEVKNSCQGKFTKENLTKKTCPGKHVRLFGNLIKHTYGFPGNV